MWQAVADVIKAALSSENEVLGMVIVIIAAWMIDRWLLVRDLRQLNKQMIDAFQENTKAITELSTLIGQLCSRI